MNKNQVEGRLEEVKGAIKEATGKVVGSNKLKAEGQADKIAGKVQANVGDAIEKVKQAIKKSVAKV